MKQNKTFAEILRRERRALSLTQRDLGKAIGVAGSHIASLETGRRKPSTALLERIANALNFDAQKLFLLTRPEAKAIIYSASTDVRKPKDPTQAWREFVTDHALLRRYQVTPRELKALKHLSLLGYILTPHEFLAIVGVMRCQANGTA